jgi:two-component system, NtrC family, sensor kinase
MVGKTSIPVDVMSDTNCLEKQPQSMVAKLSLESTLKDLALWEFSVDADQSAGEVKKIFEETPLLPGVILMEQENFLGMISRRHFLEYMSRPYGIDLFSKRSLQVLHRYTRSSILILSGNTTVAAAVQQALQRQTEHLNEPLIVEIEPKIYRLLDIHQLLVTQTQIHELAIQLIHEQTQTQLIQSEKMASLGQMVAGVAHEILNPVNFIWGNVNYLSNYGQDLIHLLEVYDSEFPQSSPKVEEVKEEIDIEFLLKDFPQVLASMKMGAERLKKIIGALRNFSHMDDVNRRATDLHESIENTLLILSNRTKHGIGIARNYGNLPSVKCYPGQLSQVFMNLISNAIDALAETAPDSKPTDWQPKIEITTQVCSKTLDDRDTTHWISIRIADNGPGIPAAIQSRIFDTFFTTKPVGKGTGLGLAISHQIVVDKHKGQLNLHSQPGVGTEFEVLLPLD